MATHQRPPASRMSVGGNILSRMLQLEKQSKQTRSSSSNPTQDGIQNPLSMNPPAATVSAHVPPTKTARQNIHTPASPAAVRQSQSVPRPPAPTLNPSPDLRSQSPSKLEPAPSPARPSNRPSIMPRSHTLPALSLDVKASDSKTPNKDSKNEVTDDEDSGSEICQSPSWSDFGGAKRKKEKKRQEKERKEEEKRLKKEEAKQKAADSKANKRLSKRPPPAAMETQKMPSALRRNSIISFISSHSSSGENTRRQSRDEKRLSMSSIDSSRGAARSQSTPATSTDLRPDSSEGHKSTISSVAPQLPRLPHLGWHSRSGSPGTDKSNSWGSEDAYEKELVKFAYQFQASANPSAPTDIILGNVNVNQVSMHNAPKRQSGAWPMARSRTDSELARINGNLKINDLEHRPPVPRQESSGDKSAANGHLGSHGGHADSHASRPKSRDSDGHAQTDEGHPNNNRYGRPLADSTKDRHGKPHAPAKHRAPSFDGSSYVHKQRMHQQQLSLAGWEDEQAVRIANERAVEEEEGSEDEGPEVFVDANEATSQPQPKVEQPSQRADSPKQQVQPLKPQTEPLKLQVALPSVPSETEVKKVEPPQTREGKNVPQPQNQRTVQDGLVLKDFRKSATTAPSPTSRNSKMNGILGFGRRQKSDQEKQSLPAKADKKSSRTSPPPPPPKESSTPPVPASPQGKLDIVKAQKVVESKAKAQHHRRSETVEIVKPEAKTEETKPATTQSHSRTRTSSSQLLNEDLPFSRPLPRSITTPVLSSDMKLPSAMADRSRNESPSKLERKSVTFDRSIADTPADEQQSQTSPAKAPEIIVESVSPEGLIRKTSIKRPRSNPNLQLAATNAQPPCLDFLPQLKHQPLPKRSPNRSSFMPSTEGAISSQFPAPVSLALKPTSDPSTNLPLSSSSPQLPSANGSPLRPESYAGPSSSSAEMSLRSISNDAMRRRSLNPSVTGGLTRTSALNPPNVFGRTPTPLESVNAKPIAKLFVICCKCNYWHDLPSHLYEAMCVPKNLTKNPEGKADAGGKGKGAEATLETMVRCPWCEHSMATWCCAGWTAILYLQERHH
ncbi:MAG: hypothetical protein Q9181_006208 [Wetmoreana brouardii]